MNGVNFVLESMLSLNSDFPVFGCPIHSENDKMSCSPVVSQREMHGFHGSTDVPDIFTTLEMCHEKVHIFVRFLYMNGMCYWK